MPHKSNRRVNVVIIFMLVFQTLFTSFAIPAQSIALGHDDQIIDTVTYDVQQLEDEGTAPVTFEWSVADLEVEVGEVYQFPMVDNFIIDEDQSGDLLTDEEEKVGQFSVSSKGIVSLVFTEEINDNPDAAGSFVVEAVKQDEVEQTNEEEVKGTDGTEKDEAEEAETAKDEESLVVEEENNEDKTEVKENDGQKEQSTGKLNSINTSQGSMTIQSNNGTTNVEPGTKFHLTGMNLTDLFGNAFTEDNPFNPNGEFRLTVDWKLDNGHGFNENDQINFSLPKQIEISNQIKLDLNDAFNNTVAKVVIDTNNVATLTFTDFVENSSDVIGEFQIIAELDQDETEEKEGNIEIDHIDQEGKLEIPINMITREKDVQKNGDPNRKYEADYIDWEIIVNSDRVSLEGAQITDILPAGVVYVDGSLEIYKQSTSVNGTVLSEENVTDQIGYQINDGKITFNFGDIYEQYAIRYRTDITDSDVETFINSATFVTSNEDDKQASATIEIIRGKPLMKQASA